MEAPRPKAGASRKGNVFVKVPLPAIRKGHFPATRSGSAAHPFVVKQLSAILTARIICARHYDGMPAHVTGKSAGCPALPACR